MSDGNNRPEKHNYWKAEETSLVLKLYRANLSKIGFGKQFKNKLRLFEFISRHLNSTFGIERTPRNVADKLKNMRYLYKMKNRQNGNVKGSDEAPTDVVDAEEGSDEEWLDDGMPPMQALVIERLPIDSDTKGPNTHIRWTDLELEVLKREYDANINNVGTYKLYRTKMKLYNQIALALHSELGSQKTAQNIADRVKNINYYYKQRLSKERTDALFQGPDELIANSEEVTIEKTDDWPEEMDTLFEPAEDSAETAEYNLNKDGSLEFSDDGSNSNWKWKKSEEEFIKRMYFDNLPNLGPCSLFVSKLELYAYIARNLNKNGSSKTTEQVRNKFKNMIKLRQLHHPDQPQPPQTANPTKSKGLEVSFDAADSDFEWPEPVPRTRGHTTWTHDEERFLIKMYDQNVHQIGANLQFRTKAMLSAHIARHLQAIGSNKTTNNVIDKLKNLKKHKREFEKGSGEPNVSILEKYENLRNWDEDEVSFLLSTYNANVKNIGYGKRFVSKPKLWQFIASELRANFKTNKTAACVAKKFQNLAKAKIKTDSTEWGPEELTFVLTLHCESKDDIENEQELFKFIADEFQKNFVRSVTAEEVQAKYNYVMSQDDAYEPDKIDASAPIDEPEKPLVVQEKLRVAEQTGTSLVWSAEETEMLTSLYNENMAEIGVGKQYKYKIDLWQDIAKEMTMLLGSTKTPLQISSKYKNLRTAEKAAKKKQQLQPAEVIEFHEKYNHLMWSEAEEAELDVLYKLHCREVGPLGRFKTKEHMWVHIAKQLSEKFGATKSARNAFVKYKGILADRKAAPPTVEVEEKFSPLWSVRETQFLLDSRKKIDHAFKPRPDQMWDLVAVPLNKFFKNNRTDQECKTMYQQLQPQRIEQVFVNSKQTIIVRPPPLKKLKIKQSQKCSLCMMETECDEIFAHNEEDLVENIFLVTGIRFKNSTIHPPRACHQCLVELKSCLDFRHKVQTSYEISSNSVDVVETDSCRLVRPKSEVLFDCDKCGETFNNKQDLLKHLKNACSICCTICSENFFNESFLENHMTTAHTDAGQNKNKSTDNMEIELDPLLDDNMPANPVPAAKMEHACIDCAMVFESNMKLIAHNILRHNKKVAMFSCRLCKPPLTFINQEHLEAHKKRVKHYLKM